MRVFFCVNSNKSKYWAIKSSKTIKFTSGSKVKINTGQSDMVWISKGKGIYQTIRIGCKYYFSLHLLQMEPNRILLENDKRTSNVNKIIQKH